MEFFCYHEDRVGSMTLRHELLEHHWAYMDQFDAALVARGPTFTADGTLTGSVHIVDLPDPHAARRFAFEEPGYRAGIYRDVLLRRWHNALGRTMWDYAGNTDSNRYLALGFTSGPRPDHVQPPSNDQLIAFGPLLSDDGTLLLGAAVLMEATDAQAAHDVIAGGRYEGIEVHHWRPGGRPG
jgi:uncharacterized protein YciI